MELDTQLKKAGIELFGTNSYEIENLILKIIDSKNIRYLKQIPFLIYLHRPNIEYISTKTRDSKLLDEIIFITQLIFHEKNIHRDFQTIPTKTESITNYDEYLQEFELQKRKHDLSFESPQYEQERERMFYLSEIFTKKEIHILHKIQKNQELTKTEYEYFSRKTKKKCIAIQKLGPTTEKILHQKISTIPQSIIAYKKVLEEEISTKESSPCTITKILCFDKQLSITYTKNNEIYNTKKIDKNTILEHNKEYLL